MSGRPRALIRQRQVRVIDLSRSGCLIESRRKMRVGTVGRLRLVLGDQLCEDDVEVVRCDAVPDEGALYYVAMRFLWTTPPQAGSIRHAMEGQVSELETPETTVVM
jgi:hypothetical protein